MAVAVPSPSPLEAQLFQLLDPAGIRGSPLLLGRWVLHPISLPSRVLGRDVAVAVLLRELYRLLELGFPLVGPFYVLPQDTQLVPPLDSAQASKCRLPVLRK